MDFNSGDAMNIAYTSVTKTTGSTSAVDPPSTLDKYNVQDADLPSIKQKILNNQGYGLPHYQRSMNANALNGLGSGWTLQELADVIDSQSF
jgi:hypothetical protein